MYLQLRDYPLRHLIADLFSALLHRSFLTCGALLRCSAVWVCGYESIIHRHMHSSLWNLSIIDSASPTVEMVRGLSISMSLYCVCVCARVRAFACERLCVYAHVKKRLERGERKTRNVRAEHGAVQCKVRPLCLLSFSNTSLMGFWWKQRSFIHLSLLPSSPSTPQPLSLYFSGWIFINVILLPALLSSLLSLAPWLFCCIAAKMGP